MATTGNDLKWFEDFYLGIDRLKHPHLVRKQSPEFKKSYFQAIMPAMMTMVREDYSCRDVYHPDKTCSQYIRAKYLRASKISFTITFFASFLP